MQPDLRYSAWVAHYVTHGKTIRINKRETTYAALGQFNGRVGTARTQAKADYRSVVEDGTFEETRTSFRQRRLYLDNPHLKRYVTAVPMVISLKREGRAVGREEGTA